MRCSHLPSSRDLPWARGPHSAPLANPVLTHGKLHVEPLPEAFPGGTEAGAAVMVARVRAASNIRFQGAAAPKVLFTDRGNGF